MRSSWTKNTVSNSKQTLNKRWLSILYGRMSFTIHVQEKFWHPALLFVLDKWNCTLPSCEHLCLFGIHGFWWHGMDGRPFQARFCICGDVSKAEHDTVRRDGGDAENDSVSSIREGSEGQFPYLEESQKITYGEKMAGMFNWQRADTISRESIWPLYSRW
jgi:hypothetical protein